MAQPGLAGRRALVTGGARGLGEAICSRLVASGAEVTLADVDAAEAILVAARLGATPLELDVADPAAVAGALEAREPYAILVNNAGIADRGFFEEYDAARWRRVLAVNLEGVFACTLAVLPAMRAAGYGRIVNVSSEAGRLGARGDAIYAASKGAVIAFTKSVAREAGPFGVTVNAIAPGPIETPLLRAAYGSGDRGARVVAGMEAATVLGRLGRPEEVAAAVGFLVSEEAAYVTGETLGVSGGMGMG
jgi:2-hydroxycyclohexanecarboxyl-CoA dehydrogenase